MDDFECEECGQTQDDDVTAVVIEAEPCDDDCQFGCNHPTHRTVLCSDCAEPSSFDSDDRAVRRAESGYAQ